MGFDLEMENGRVHRGAEVARGEPKDPILKRPYFKHGHAVRCYLKGFDCKGYAYIRILDETLEVSH
jgi:hypothetical protein